MRELLETLRNTDTLMAIYPSPLGLEVQFVHNNNGDPKQYGFIVSDSTLGTPEVSLESFFMKNLEWFLKRLGIETHA